MIRFATYGFAAALIGATAGAASAETYTTTVKSVDAAQQVIVLDDGRALALQSGLDVTGLEPGMTVTLNIEEVGGTEVVTEILMN